MANFQEFEVWFVTGAQLLYGGDAVKQVDAHSNAIVKGLNESGNLPIKIVYKGTVNSEKEVTAAFKAANNDNKCVGIITWAKANPELSAKMKSWFSGKAPVIDWKAIEQKPNQATRAASATVLGVLATQVENMICASADLSNSDKTDGFLKKTHGLLK